MTQLLSTISTNGITMLKDVNALIEVNKAGKFKYCYIPNMKIIGIVDFINKLEDDSIYVMIPIISTFGRDNDPHITLSKQILISNNSSSKTIYDYLSYQLDKAILDFGITNLDTKDYFQLIFNPLPNKDQKSGVK